MHATRDTSHVINLNRAGGRVMRGVRLLVRYKNSADGMRRGGGWRNILLRVSPAMMDGLVSGQAGGGRHEAGCKSPFREPAAGGALKVTQSNKRMHATRDTNLVMLRVRCGRARDARRYAAVSPGSKRRICGP
jgi:hypothetical protein